MFINPGSLDEPATAAGEVTGGFSLNEQRLNRLGYNGTVSCRDEISIATNFASAVIGGVRQGVTANAPGTASDSSRVRANTTKYFHSSILMVRQQTTMRNDLFVPWSFSGKPPWERAAGSDRKPLPYLPASFKPPGCKRPR
jgi:hypothetical protein